jgi:hypothetical protein
MAGPPRWGGCRRVTNKIIRIVDGDAPVTSRKRAACYGNCGSDHHISQLKADAVDFGTANNYRLRDKIMRKLGYNGNVVDYGNYYITHRGKRYRIQPIAGTHGTGPHLHIGVRRV